MTHILCKVSCFFFIEISSFSYVTETIVFSHTNPNISNVTQQCQCSYFELGLPVAQCNRFKLFACVAGVISPRLLGILKFDDCNGNGNVKKAGLRLAKKHFCKCSTLFVHFVAVTTRLRREKYLI